MKEKVIRLTFILGFLMLSATAFSATCNFNGGGACDGNWNDADCWSCGSVPVEGDDVIIDEAVTLNVSISWTSGSITITGTGSLTHNGGSPDNLTIGGAATLTIDAGGVLDVAGLNVSGGTVDNSGDIIAKSITQTGGTFNNYSGATVSALGTPGSITVSGGVFNSTDADIHTDGNLNVNAGGAMNITGGTLNVDAFTSVGGTLNITDATVTLGNHTTVPSGGAINVNGDSDVDIAGNLIIHGTLTVDNGSADPDFNVTGTVSGTGDILAGATDGATIGYNVSTFTGNLQGTDDGAGTLTLGAGLPIELLSFEADLNEKTRNVDLLWITLSEADNDYFTVQRSMNGHDWSELMEVDGAGTSSIRLDYFEVDGNPLLGDAYYRLKQTDFNGSYSYSPIVSVSSILNSELTVYPSPVNGGDNIVVLLPEGLNSTIEATIYSLDGKSVYQSLIHDLYSRQMILNIPIDLSAGTYILKVNSEATRFVVK